jgi:pyridoxal phosphate enzyme (YggS family)
MSDLVAQIAGNLEAIQGRIDDALKRSERSPGDVRLIAVTKYAKLPWVQALVDLGVNLLGESRPQQLVERTSQVAGAVDWHLIGHLQRNKVRLVLPHVRMIHSVDSLRLARRIDEVAGELSLRPTVLLETNVSGEASKDGFSVAELTSAWSDLTALAHVEIAGLMTMAPASESPESARPVFETLHDLRERLAAASPAGLTLPELSMGMSADFEVAIEEGATLVRIGSALYEGLD